MKITVIRFSSLGDCILLCPFLEHLKRCGAEQVSVITKAAYVELFAAARGVDRIAAIPPGSGWRGVRQLIESQRDEDTYVIDAHHTLRSRVVARGLGGADARLEKSYRERIQLILFKRPATLPSMGARYSALGEALGLPPVPFHAGGIEVPQAATERVSRRLTADRYVIMAPGARWASKRWPLDHFIGLAKRIANDYNYHVTLLGDSHDRAACAAVAEALGEAATDLSGDTGIMDAAAAIAAADCFIGNDSGLMHLSEAVGVPVIALFGPTVEAFGYYPTLARSKVIERRLSCRPCSRNGKRTCPKGTRECLTEIPIAVVADAFEDFLNERGSNRYVVD